MLLLLLLLLFFLSFCLNIFWILRTLLNAWHIFLLLEHSVRSSHRYTYNANYLLVLVLVVRAEDGKIDGCCDGLFWIVDLRALYSTHTSTECYQYLVLVGAHTCTRTCSLKRFFRFLILTHVLFTSSCRVYNSISSSTGKCTSRLFFCTPPYIFANQTKKSSSVSEL